MNSNERGPLLPLIKAQEQHLKGEIGSHAFRVGDRSFVVNTTIEPSYDENGNMYFDVVSNVVEVESVKPDSNGNYNYISNLLPLNELDVYYTNQFRTLYSKK